MSNWQDKAMQDIREAQRRLEEAKKMAQQGQTQ
jgi:uncharacterized protein with GYD domain